MKKKTTLSFLFGALALCVSNTASAIPYAPSSDLEIFGSVVFGDGWAGLEDAPYGIYSIKTSENAPLNLVKKGKQYIANGGAVYVGGKYYSIGYERGYWGELGNVYFRVYDVEDDWKLVRETYLSSMSDIPTDLTYNPIDDCVYGCFYTSDESTFSFSRLNLLTGKAESLATLSEQLVSIAARKDGTMYAMGVSGIVYRVDMTDGVNLVKVGNSGLTVRYAQSATFDNVSDRLFWSATMHDVTKGSSLYEVNVNDGSVNYISHYDDGMQMTGIFTRSEAAKSSAPNKVSDASFTVTKDALSGNITFTMPTTTYDGTTISGDLEYDIVVDEEESLFTSGSVTAGNKVVVPFSFTEPGMHMLRISAINDEGRGPVSIVYKWIGADKAKAINPVLTQTISGLHILWTAPTTGVNGGYINTSKLSYAVVRMPDNVKVYEGTDTQCTDAFTTTELNKYWYDVVAYDNGVAGETASTNSLVLGNAMSIPYYQDFTTGDAFNFFTVIDNNNDGSTWYHEDDYAAYDYSEKNSADDWLITPLLAISSDYVYELTLNVKALTALLPERMEVYMGNSATIDAMQTKLVEPTLVNWGDYMDVTTQIRPTDKDAKCLGIHAISDANMNELCINYISVKKLASSSAPDSVINLKAVPADLGELKATLTFKLPTKALNGVDAAGVKAVKIYRNKSLIATLTDKNDGEECTYIDNAAVQGFNTYRVEATNDSEGCVSSSVKVYVGNDVPEKVSDIKLVDKGEGQLSLTWNAPNIGVNGGYINTNSLTYDVKYCGVTASLSGTAEKSYEEKFNYPADYQKLIWYSITSNSDAGVGATAQSDTLFLGNAYKLPFVESFSRMAPDNRTWNPVSDGIAEWKFENAVSVDPQDGDGGCALFSPKMPNTTASLVSPKIDLTGNDNPVLTFWMWHNRHANNQVSVSLRNSDGSEQLLEAFNSKDVSDVHNEAEWRMHTVYLKNYDVDSNSQLVFRAVNKSFDITSINYLAVDNIRIRNVYDCDLRVNSIEGPIEVAVGAPITFSVEVENYGAEDVNDYKVELYRSGRLVATVDGADLASEAKQVIELTDVPNADADQTSKYYAKVVCEADQFLDNNTSETRVATVTSGLPFVDDLSGAVADGATVLTWSQPPTVGDNTEEGDGTVTEDFESYAAFTITNAGSWTLYDGDKASTGGILDNSGYFVQYDNVEKPMSFMVFNPTEAGLASTTWAAHSGKQVMASFLSTLRYSPDDDWLISPELDGSAQTITFWAKAPNRSYYMTSESVELLYSTTDTEISSFTKVGTTLNINSESWKKYTFNVPEGAKYFAFRKVSQDQYILYIDDVTYRPASNSVKLFGYNVYRNNTLITSAPISATTYTDTEVGVNEYTVTAVYDKGESIHSNVYSNDLSGIDDLVVDKQIKIQGGVGHIRVTQPKEHQVRIVTVDGKVVATVTGNGVVSLSSGVYVIHTNGYATKVLVY